MTPQEQPSICVGCRFAEWTEFREPFSLDEADVITRRGGCTWELSPLPKFPSALIYSMDVIYDDARVGFSSCPVREPEGPKP